MTWTPERLKELSAGYGLDGGGYSFENSNIPALQNLSVVVWDDPDPDYVPWIKDGLESNFYSLSCPLYAFFPYGTGFGVPMREPWPATLEEEDGTRWKLHGRGSLMETERECTCHGKFQCPNCEQEAPYEDAKFCPECASSYLDSDNKIRPNAWVFTGNVKDKSLPSCDICEGSGYITSEGGEWALYARQEDEDQDSTS